MNVWMNGPIPIACMTGWENVKGPGTGWKVLSGFPRSQARPSKSPKMWQLAHASAPCVEIAS
jgi:hypothetical protein